MSLGRDDQAVGGALQRSVAGIGREAGWQRDLEISLPLDRKIEIAAGRRKRPLGDIDGNGGRTNTKTELHTGWDGGAVGGGDGSRSGQLLVVEVGEFGATGIVPGRRHVREIVGDDLDTHLLGRHSGGGDL